MMEPVVFRGLKLLNYLRKINLSSEETLALIRRLETKSCGPEDCEVLIRIVQAHTEFSADFLQGPPCRWAACASTPGQTPASGRQAYSAAPSPLVTLRC